MSEATASADLLAAIVAATRRSVETRQIEISLASLARQAESVAARPGRFRDALGRADRVNIIAECKRRSPSRGVLRREYDAATIARGYETAGAAAISVLTEPSFFDGSLSDLRAVRAAVAIPILRKDFVVTQYQLLEARAAGADAVLLIVAALTAEEFRMLHRQASDLGLDVLVEVHDVDELSVAIDAGSVLIGVNNRNLKTLSVDVRISEDVAVRMPRGVVAVSESGLKTPADLTRLRGLGYSAFLIGERFMSEAEPGAALGRLLAGVVA